MFHAGSGVLVVFLYFSAVHQCKRKCPAVICKVALSQTLNNSLLFFLS